jgi:hypothetical protein
MDPLGQGPKVAVGLCDRVPDPGQVMSERLVVTGVRTSKLDLGEERDELLLCTVVQSRSICRRSASAACASRRREATTLASRSTSSE